MRSTPLHRSGGRLAAAACALALLAGAFPTAAYAAVDDGTVASGDDWTVEKVAGGYQVTLELDEPLPIVSDAPTLLVDGADIGYALESADGLSLTAFTADGSVADATEVEKGWSSGTDKATETETAPVTKAPSATARKLDAAMRDVAETQALALDLDEDPGAPGDFAVTEAEYDFGNSVVPLDGIGGVYGEMTGKLYLSDAEGARPVVLLMHGRHTSCSTGTANPLRWPCGDTQVNVRSYLGYEGTARALASHGYNVVSIAVNAVNSNDNQLAADYGAYARGQMVLETLGMLETASEGETVEYVDQQTGLTRDLDGALTYATTRTDAPAVAAGVTAASLAGRFDLDHVGIMGHSRGGEGVMSAATLNLGLDDPFGIEAVLPLAPVDFGRMTLPDTPMLTILPYCDGDVSNQQGQHMYDDSRNAFGDDVQRAAMWVMGANHNFFNSVWTPGKYPYATGDDWSTRDTTSTCATTDSTRLTADEQYQVGVSYMTGYFRYVMGGEEQFAPLFDGSVKPSTPDTGDADVRVMASQPTSATTMLADFTSESSLVRTTGTGSKVQPCVNATGVTFPQSAALCVTTRTSSGQFPHWAQMRFGGNVPAFPVTRFTWTTTGSDLRVTVPKAKRDVSAAAQLTFKTMPDESVPTGTDFTVSVIDGDGATWSKPASELNALAVNRLPGGTNTTLNKLVMQQVTVPTSAITGIDLTDVREVRFTAAVGADTTTAGGIYLSDLAFDTPDLGVIDNGQHVTINVGGTTVDEGDAAGTVDVPVWLSTASDERVTGYLSSVGSATGRAGIGMQKVTFAPGEVCKVVEMPLQGDTLASATASTAFVLAVTNTQNAVMGADAFGWLTLREDDAVTVGSLLPVVGEQGDACAEAKAALTVGDLDVTDEPVVVGSTIAVAGDRFRAGETVTVALGGTAATTVVADADGAFSTEVAIAADAEAGPVRITATGAGTGIVDAAVIEVVESDIALTLSAESRVFGQAATATAVVTGSSTGEVVFAWNGTEVSAELVDGVASVRIPTTLTPGAYTVSATFTGTEEVAASRTVEASYTVTRRPVTVSLTTSAASAKAGSSVAMTVTVKGVTGAPATGTVKIYRGSSLKKSFTMAAWREGRATVQVPVGTTKGRGDFHVVYSGSTNYFSATSTVKSITIK